MYPTYQIIHKGMIVSLCALAALTIFLTQPVSAQSSLLISLKGEPAPGALLIGQVELGTKVFLNEQLLKQSESGFFAFGFGRDESGSAQLILEKESQKDVVPLQLTSRQWKIQRVEGVPQETVTPPPERLSRIRQESRLVGKARKTDSDHLYFLQPFSWPAAGLISGVYGSQRYYNGQPRRPHYGVDIAAPQGTPVYAPASGVVTLTHPDMFYSGGTLLIDHGFGISSTFIHLYKILVTEGQTVQQGDLIAEIGSSGRATGAHLDWRMNWYKKRLDPQWFLDGSHLSKVPPHMVKVNPSDPAAQPLDQRE